MALNLLAGLVAGGGGGGLNPFVGLTAAMQPFQKAVQGSTGQLQQMSGVLSPFVNAIQPAVVQAVGRAFNDLNAVIGTALVPVMEGLIPIIRGFADSLFPVMKQLAPILGSLMDTVASALQPVFDALTEVLLALMPAFEALTTLVGDLFTIFANLLAMAGELFSAILSLVNIFAGPVVDVLQFVVGILRDWNSAIRVGVTIFAELVRVFAEWVNGLFGRATGQLKDTLANLREAFQELLKNTILLVATFFKMIGFTAGLDAIIRAIKGRQEQKTEGIAVANNPAFKSISDFGRDINQQAFVATAANEERREQIDFLKSIEDQLIAIRNNDRSFAQMLAVEIVNAMLGAAQDASREPTIAAASAGVNAARGAHGVVMNPFGALAAMLIG